jgi:hypothetical protein
MLIRNLTQNTPLLIQTRPCESDDALHRSFLPDYQLRINTISLIGNVSIVFEGNPTQKSSVRSSGFHDQLLVVAWHCNLDGSGRDPRGSFFLLDTYCMLYPYVILLVKWYQ